MAFRRSAPVTFRDLIILMLRSLPKEIRSLFAASLKIDEVTDVSHNPEPVIDPITQWSKRTLTQVLSTWGMMMHPMLDLYPDMPFIYANVKNPEKVLKREFHRLLKHYRKQSGITQTRNKSVTKYLNDLHVWDLREGWQKGHYEMKKRRTLKQISSRSKKSIQTLHSQYLRAFKLITSYSILENAGCSLCFQCCLLNS